jgi:hypothetical protein
MKALSVGTPARIRMRSRVKPDSNSRKSARNRNSAFAPAWAMTAPASSGPALDPTAQANRRPPLAAT